MTIVSDVDGVLSSFESVWEPLLAKIAGGSKLPKGWLDDPNQPNEWDWDKTAYGKDITSKGWEHVARSDKFWLDLKPLPGALKVAQQINRLMKSHDVVFMTSRPGVGVQRQTCKWLYEIGVLYPNVIVVNRWQDKVPLLMDLRTGFFIDDKLETINALYNHCYLNRLPVKQFFLADAPYNREGRVNGVKVAANVTDALKQSGLWS